MKPTAIISGGTGGLGQAFGAILRANGWFTVILCLPGPQLDALRSTPDTLAIPCDITDSAALLEAAQVIREHRPSIDLVVYNAGITHIGPFTHQTLPDHRKVFEVNYFGAVAMAKEFGPDVRRSKGTHLAISSVAGFCPLALRTAYAGSKHALEGFFKSLRSEERQHGVSCLIAAPSFIATNTDAGTPKNSGIARPGSASDQVDAMTPAQAAETLYRGLKRRRDFIPIGRVARLSNWINRLSPGLYQRLMERAILAQASQKPGGQTTPHGL
ncbi:SDR family oxidoreductase [Labrenzia sp. PHM005]|uniref:SDR family NAD(P)-dependent oxidoreductase n=1 Tax=Labrenzia sp. PHM005 TaxID=2590016 RepID=UPI0011408B60|nr:SDR family NAD(P)-dependent oxidoreductase [Labrenzia sp. PHM005]QDG78549.1 SDR family NAD(P)-dependent oxidoreductase [Labrenzia sp. PHM005]